jgi:hypothetical protein
VLATPGKTPDTRPDAQRPYSGFVNSSLDLFAALRAMKVEVGASSMLGVQEVYPAHIWKILATSPLEPKTTVLGRDQRARILTQCGVSGLPARPGHDQLDACVSALLGAAADGLVTGVSVRPVGVQARWDAAADSFREGVILSAVRREADANRPSGRSTEVSPNDYSIAEHRHRFAAWAAGRAASVSTCRFKVSEALTILDGVGLQRFLVNPDLLPAPALIDDAHRRWRDTAVSIARKRFGIEMSHGVAAKLINVYFKSGLVCGGYADHDHVAALHPPIDAVLLRDLARRNVGGLSRRWLIAQHRRWSKLSSRQYEDVIEAIRTALGDGEPLWKIETYWQGHQ